MHIDCERILFTEEQIKRRVAEVAKEVNAAFAGKEPLCVGILKGSVIFFADFVRLLDIPVEFDFISVSSYGLGAVSSGNLKVERVPEMGVSGRDVIIIEDIIDSGLTLAYLKTLLKSYGAKSVTLVTLLNKRKEGERAVAPDYNCFEVEDEFVIGYGLDYAGRYRSLPYIAVLKKEIYKK